MEREYKKWKMDRNQAKKKTNGNINKGKGVLKSKKEREQRDKRPQREI